jgi:hypothetical protein
MEMENVSMKIAKCWVYHSIIEGVKDEMSSQYPHFVCHLMDKCV